MAMTTGELDFDDLYHQQEGEDEIAFPPLSFLLWIVFLVLMPVLLSNLLVSCYIFWNCCTVDWDIFGRIVLSLLNNNKLKCQNMFAIKQ